MKINKKNFKRLFIIATLIMAIFTAYEIMKTYAVFYTEISGTASENLARWNILVNNTDITNGTTQQFVMENLNIETKDTVEEGKIAPSQSGSFEIIIDPTDTQVSVRYDISIDKSALTNSKMNLITVEETALSNTITKTGENTYTGVMLLKDIKDSYENKIKITFNWENDETNNKQDTELGTKINSKIQIPIIVKVTQYLGEEINPYTE